MVEKAVIIVSGTVQGVGFRYNVVNYAKRIELTGYAKNLMDGNVEVFAEGSKESIIDLFKFIKNSPGSSSVRETNIDWKEPANRDYYEFKIKF